MKNKTQMKKAITVCIFAVLAISLISFAVASAGIDAKEKPEKITFIHYKDGKVKPIDSNGKPANTATCYKLLGVKWSTLPVSYVINPTNSNGLSENFVTNAISLSAEEWDAYTSRELFNNAYTINYTADWDDTSPDLNNEYSFGLYPQQNVIAVTNVWYNSRTKQIVDYDILFNTYYAWGDATINPSIMDLQNIATHETGHGIGLADLYNRCIDETMYGYSDFGETSKRDLNKGDIAGLRKIYGN